jgi:lysophospholipase L1-like esterase
MWMREQLAEIVEKLRARGDANLHYLHGHRMLGPDDAAKYLMPDGVHPNGDGYALMGQRFAELTFGPTGPLTL